MFHDVDLLPENDFNAYECDTFGPRHLSPAVDELRYLYVNEMNTTVVVVVHTSDVLVVVVVSV
jgi:hypothetical protein